ncbi:FkbM family methyltransferase [Brevibacillus agri]|uniref:FkbM family methyltransferase n=1 Tax=Brevibacillus TaxID=55080 RepID=UPI000271CC79|nr:MULTISPECIES: FkbM family methyltransferase [Brevibacillus]EJL43059.1 methyltransferase, FkbM family [Brevibacillus sp. CF112]MBG9564164.1 methyltransferase [Brevibacillus agri]MCG5251755.1 FkbM family methyltransferase [Brevibacillus agri]MED3500371.1 FkbM family methyltransferase [Brevibacillus agri]QHZ57545.1 FkbM family methyltransferase [Brevibacillus sp. NSP2.1]
MSRMDEIRRVWQQELRIPFPLTAQETWDFWLLESPQYEVKTAAVTDYGKRHQIRTFIETGTYRGYMVAAQKAAFSRIYSIELDPALYLAAKTHFAADEHVSILHGDSSKVLPELLASITEPCLFWLDGHYIPLSTESAKGNLDTPILEELAAILSHPVRNHVILIDDARCFIGSNPLLKDYPTIAELKQYVADLRPDLHFEVKDDIIRIYTPIPQNAQKTVTFRLPFDDKSFLVHGSSFDQSVLYYIEMAGGLYEEYVLNVLKRVVQPDYTCLDIGANLGTISLALSHLAPRGKVYAFEPSAVNLAFMKQTLHDNGASNVEPVPLGVFDRNGIIEFCEVDRGGGWSFIASEATSAATNTISCTRLDDWVAARSLSRIDLIKLDVEGSEIQVLQGGMETFKTFDPDLVIEFNPDNLRGYFGKDPNELFLCLFALYSHLYLIKRDGGLMKITSYTQLLDAIKPFHGDLFCTNKTILL